MGLPRVEEIFEARPPTFKALIADVDGKVLALQDKGKQKVLAIEVAEPAKKRIPCFPNITVSVGAGDLVTVGQQLSEGHVDLKGII